MLKCLPPSEPVTFPSHHQLHLHPIQAPGWTPMANEVFHTDSSYKEMVRISSIINNLMIDDQDHYKLIISPDRDHVHNVLLLHRCKSNTLSSFISSYFLHSDKITTVCLSLRSSLIAACRLYSPIQTLILHHLPIDSLSDSNCNLAFQQLLQFTEEPNPFPHRDSETFDAAIEIIPFCDLKNKIDRRLRKSTSRIRFVPPATTACCSGTGAAFTGTEEGYAQIVSGNTFYLKHGFDSLHRLVVRLHNAVEHDKNAIREYLKNGNDSKTVRKVLEDLRHYYQITAPALVRFEEERHKYFTVVKESRKELLQKILLKSKKKKVSFSTFLTKKREPVS